MKKTTFLLAALLLCALLLASCSVPEYEPDYYTIAVGDYFAGRVSPFYAQSEGDLLALSLVCVSPLARDKDGALVDGCGHIDTETIESDGEEHLLATVTLNKKYRFSNGKKQTIDDLIFMYYIFCDPCYTGVHSEWHTLGVVGAEAYYYDDPEWSGELPDFEGEAERNYSPGKISDADLRFYFIESSIGGEYNGLDGLRKDSRTWKDFLIDEGYGEAVEAIGNDDSRALEVAAGIYVEKYREGYDYTTWWKARLEYNYLRDRLDKIDVKEIAGIKKIDDYTCTVEFESADADYLTALNVPIASKANYSSSMPKGNGDYIASSGSRAIVIGAGAYSIERNEGGIIDLDKNRYFPFGKNAVEGVEIRTIDSSDTLANVALHTAAVGFASGERQAIASECERLGLSFRYLSGGAVVYDAEFLDLTPLDEYREFGDYAANIWRAKAK